MKKTLLFGLSFLLFGFSFTSCEMEDDDPMVELPTTITDYLSENYSGYEIDESELGTMCDGTDVYEVELEDSKENEVELTFHAYTGNLLYTETEINTADLPSEVSNSIAENYANHSIDEAEQLEMEDGTIRYEVEVSEGTTTLNVLTEADGTIICDEVDDDNDD